MRTGFGDRVRRSLAWAIDCVGAATVASRRRSSRAASARRVHARGRLAAAAAPCAAVLRRRRPRRPPPCVARARDATLRRVQVVDPATGLVRTDRRFSSHRDTVVTSNNAYANAMVVALDRTLRETGWFAIAHPGRRGGSVRRGVLAGRPLRRHAGRRPGHRATARSSRSGSGSCPTSWASGRRWPRPGTPVSRTRSRCAMSPGASPADEDRVQRLFVPDYQGTAIWTSLGAIYLQLLDRVDPDAADRTAGDLRRMVERRAPSGRCCATTAARTSAGSDCASGRVDAVECDPARPARASGSPAGLTRPRPQGIAAMPVARAMAVIATAASSPSSRFRRHAVMAMQAVTAIHSTPM